MARSSPRLVPSNDDDGTLKRLFAAALLRQPHKPHEAAKRVFPGTGNTARAMHASQHWPTDPDVVALMDELTDADGLPDLRQTAREIWTICTDPEAAARDRISAIKLYTETMGYKAVPADGGDTGGFAELFGLIASEGRPKPATAG